MEFHGFKIDLTALATLITSITTLLYAVRKRNQQKEKNDDKETKDSNLPRTPKR